MKRRRKRNRLEIYLDVLSAVEELEKEVKTHNKGGFDAAKPTPIMYKANLSWYPCKNLLEFAEREGTVKKEDVELVGDKRTDEVYSLTDQGLNIVNYYKVLNHRKVENPYEFMHNIIKVDELNGISLTQKP